MFDPKDLITANEAARLVGGENSPVHVSTLWRWVKAGRISAPYKPAPGTVRFSRSKLLKELGLQIEAA